MAGQFSPARRGRPSMWRNLFFGEIVLAIVIVAIFSADYSPVVWLAVAVLAVTTPLVLIGWLRSR